MALHHSLLSLLDQGESYGYELKGVFERSVGPQWGTLNIGHLYQVLDRLKRDGHVKVLRAEPQPRRPDRLIYAITESGRAELRAWLRNPSPPAAGYRDDLYLKLVAAARAGTEELTGVIRREREAQLGELHALRRLAAPEADALTALLTEGAALHVEARLRLLELAEQDTANLVAVSSSAGQRGAGEAEEPDGARRKGAGHGHDHHRVEDASAAGGGALAAHGAQPGRPPRLVLERAGEPPVRAIEGAEQLADDRHADRQAEQDHEVGPDARLGRLGEA